MSNSTVSPGAHPAVPSTNGTAQPSYLDAVTDTHWDGISHIIVIGAVRALEHLWVLASGALLYAGYIYPQHGIQWHYLALIPGVALCTAIVLQLLNTYTIPTFQRIFRQIWPVSVGWSMVFLGALAIAFLFKASDEISRLWLGMWYVVGLGGLVAIRLGTANRVRVWSAEGRLERRAVIVGGGKPTIELINLINASQKREVRIVGIFDDRTEERSPSIPGYPRLGKVEDLVEFARRTRVDLLIVALPLSAEARLLSMLKSLWVLPVDIRLAAHTNKLKFRPRSYSYIGNVPFIDIFDKPIQDWDVVLKWVFDKVVGTLALIAVSPIMIATAIAIKLDSKGPVLFRQKRFGFNNELIEVFKFRSMYTDMSDAAAAKLVTKDDPRVTKVGRFIRKTSIDELPQLFNVLLRGNLSLVGPRPHAVSAKADHQLYQDVVDGYYARHKVKPGITGWAQIHGWRGETDTAEKIQKRVEHDLYYIENWSVFLDLYILAMTPVSLVTKTENAY